MDRRQFLKQVALWSAGISMTVPRFRILKPAAAERPVSVVSIGTDRDYERLVARTLEPLGGIRAFVAPGAKVVIKPNIGWDRTPEQGANTHPLVVKCLARLCLDAGAQRVMVFDRTCNEERRCYTRSGILPVLEAMGERKVRCDFIDSRKFVPVEIERGRSLNRWEFYQDALDADCYINVPVAKHHGLAGLTLGLKNTMGVIGGNRGRIHQDIGQKLADLATVIQPSLTVIDATRMLMKNGPQGGNLDDVKVADTVLASADPVAADAFASTLFGLRPDDLASTIAAFRMGLGEMDLDRVKVVRS